MSAYQLMTLDPPYLLGDEQANFKLIGWTEIDDPAAPDIELTINGRPVAFHARPRPEVALHFPGIKASGVMAELDFRSLLAGVDTQQDLGGFLVEAKLRSDHRERVFEYAVTPGWMQAVFGAPLKARPVPPAHLQIRVAGAAAGEFCRAGGIAAQQIERLLAEGGGLAAGQAVLDFGCGPGRVLQALAPRHPGVRFHGCDIDAEAIAWCRDNLGDLGIFEVNGTLPPLPFGDASFDAIYGLSVFTHLPEAYQAPWLDDLRRVLKPSGRLLTTIMNPLAYDLPQAIRDSAAATGFAYWGDAAETEGLPSFYRLAYHTHDYVRREWARGFEVLRIGGHDLNDTQDSVLLRRV